MAGNKQKDIYKFFIEWFYIRVYDSRSNLLKKQNKKGEAFG